MNAIDEVRSTRSGCEYCGDDQHLSCDNCGREATANRVCPFCRHLVCEVEATTVGDARERRGLPRQEGSAWVDLDLIRRACSDPGAFIKRASTDHGDEGWPQGIEYEMLHVWQARAVVAALEGSNA